MEHNEPGYDCEETKKLLLGREYCVVNLTPKLTSLEKRKIQWEVELCLSEAMEQYRRKWDDE